MSFGQRLKDDVTFLRCIGRALLRVTPLARRRTRIFPDVAEELATRYGDRVALLSDREQLTFAEFNARGNRYARWALENGLKKGETVCLLMPNRPEYPAIWLGIARAGGIGALLNTSLTGGALAHCINIVKPKHIIVAAELVPALQSAVPHLHGGPTIWHHGGGGAAPRIDQAIMELDDAPLPPAARPSLTHDDICLYIFTSGTTGLPKAANINHYRVLAGMLAFAAVMNTSEKDRMYDCLPLYHTAGGVIALGAALTVGGSVFIREKFSARQFWDDVVDYRCTIFQYIGELCRYLLNAPPHAKERLHHIRLCCGNGLRPDIWLDFKARFALPHILEFYAATEGNALLFNFDEAPGSIGRIPPFARTVFPLRVVRFDLDREEPVRGQDGLCIECPPNEVGELISRILIDPLKPAQRFDGYADRSATEKKILRDAFEPSDLWFRSGDLMRCDARGYFYFVDRIGDTFRWKGENVATAEVAEIINTFPGVTEVNVYGVAVKGAEGKAGMAAIVIGDGFDLGGLRRHIHERLPAHARPLFVRLQSAIDATTTFKQRKLDLVAQGFDPSRIFDPLYFDDPAANRMVALDDALYRRIQSATLRL